MMKTGDKIIVNCTNCLDNVEMEYRSCGKYNYLSKKDIKDSEIKR